MTTRDHLTSLVQALEERGLRVRWRAEPPWLFTGRSEGDVFVIDTVQLFVKDGLWIVQVGGPGQLSTSTACATIDEAAALVLHHAPESNETQAAAGANDPLPEPPAGDPDPG